MSGDEALFHHVASSAADYAAQHYVATYSHRAKLRWWRRFYDCVFISLMAYDSLRRETQPEPSRN